MNRAIDDTQFAFSYAVLEHHVAVDLPTQVPTKHGEVVRVVRAGAGRDEFVFGVVHLDFDVDTRDWSEMFCETIASEASFRFETPSDRVTIAMAELGDEQIRVRVEKSGARLLVTRFRGNSGPEVEAVLASARFVRAGDEVEASRAIHRELDLPTLSVPSSCIESPLLMLDGLPTLRLERWIGNELVGRISISLSASLGDALRVQLGGWVGEAEIARLEANAGTSLVSPMGTELFATRLSIGAGSFVMSSACPGKNLNPGLWMIHRKWLADLTKQVLA